MTLSDTDKSLESINTEIETQNRAAEALKHTLDKKMLEEKEAYAKSMGDKVVGPFSYVYLFSPELRALAGAYFLVLGDVISLIERAKDFMDLEEYSVS